MTKEGLQWWELRSIQLETVDRSTKFKEELMKYFQPVNKELNTRKIKNL